MCFYGSRLYQSGDIFPSEDGCNLCVCGNGYVGCTEIACPTTGKKYTKFYKIGKTNLILLHLFIYLILKEMFKFKKKLRELGKIE